MTAWNELGPVHVQPEDRTAEAARTHRKTITMPKTAVHLFTTAALSLALSASAEVSVPDSDAPPAPGRQRDAEVRLASAELLPTAIALASAEARRLSAESAEGLVIGANGQVDVALDTLIDLALRGNLDIRVQSFSPALGKEAVRAREAIFDPLLRFTLAMLSSTNPTVGSLEGAAVLSQDQLQWDVAAQELLPWGGTLSLGFDNRRQKSNNVFATLNPSYSSNLNFSVSQPLLRNFGADITKREIRIAKNDSEASDELFRSQVISTVTAVIDAYWDLYGKIETLAVRRDSLKLADDLLRINRTRVEVGTMAPLEISAAEAEVARNDELLISAEADVTNAQDEILRLINIPVESPLWKAKMRPVDKPTIVQREIDVEKEIRTAMEKRPELRRQRLLIDNDAIRAAYAKNQLKPDLNLQASYGLAGVGGTEIVRDDATNEVVSEIGGGYGDAISGVTSLDFDTWRLAAVVEFPIFNRAARSGHATSLLSQRRDEATLEALEQSIAVNVRRLARAAQTSLKRMEAAAITRSLQEKRLDAEQKKFEHGLSTNYQVSQGQQDLTEARNNEVVAVTNYRRALAALHAVTGTTLDLHGITLEP